MRGSSGANAELRAEEAETESSAPERPPPFARQALLFASYSCSIWVTASIPALLPSLQSELSISDGESLQILTAQNVGSASGKFVAGLIVAAIGARRTGMCAYFCLALVFVSIIGASTSKAGVAACAFVMEIMNDPIYPSHAVIIRGWWPSDTLSDAFWVLAMSSRGTDMLSKVVYGSMLTKLEWRRVAILPLACAIAGVLLMAFHRDSLSKPNVRDVNMASPRNMGRVFKRILTARFFWLAASSMVPLTLVKRCGQLIPLYLFHTAGRDRECCHVDGVVPRGGARTLNGWRSLNSSQHDCDVGLLCEGDAAALSTLYQVGLLASVVLCGRLYGRLSARGKRVLCASLSLLTAASSASLALWSNRTVTAGALVGKVALTVLVAFGVGASYYIPTGIFAVRFGGDDTSSVSAVLDGVAFLSAAALLSILSQVVDVSWFGWSGFWGSICVAALVACQRTWTFQKQLHHDEDEQEQLSLTLSNSEQRAMELRPICEGEGTGQPHDPRLRRNSGSSEQCLLVKTDLSYTMPDAP